jgi:REP element-mobilizing transposase RayT
MALDLPERFGWGGKRSGAGRPHKAGAPLIPHDRALDVRSWTPVHVTQRVREHVWNLRSLRSWRVIAAALEGVRSRERLRVVHLSVQGNHLHALVEAADPRALAYVLGNFASHSARRGEPIGTDRPDQFSSAAAAGPDGRPVPVAPARTWLLTGGAAPTADRTAGSW